MVCYKGRMRGLYGVDDSRSLEVEGGEWLAVEVQTKKHDGRK